MLPRAHRMRRGSDFEQAVRRGVRGGRESLVVHLTTSTDPEPAGPVVGLVVSKAVGNAVTRNLVKRRLRSLVGARLEVLPVRSRVVVRALAPAAAASFAQLGTDLDGALSTAVRRAGERAR
ncbi:MAG TPA: ribonuclease P protein component [Propionicimonas sp.]